MNENVIIDTSAWIDFFNHADSEHSDVTEQLIRGGQAVLVGPVVFELLQGARSAKEGTLITESLRILPFLETNEESWYEAGLLSRGLRSKGITIPMSDCLIAAAAKTHSCLVYTLDQHFRHFPELLFQPSTP
ncbi:PIN domain-containing protein [Thermodesulfobacteriota bacterium]